MKWKIFAIISFILVPIIFAKWYMDSKDFGSTLYYSHDKKPIVVKTVDMLFGTETTKTDWKDGFWLGLLPSTDKPSLMIFIGAIPLGGIFIVLGAIFFYINFKKPGNKKTKVQLQLI